MSVFALSASARADLDYDADGRIRAVVDWPREAPFKAGTWIVGPQWKTILRQEALADSNRVAGKDDAFTREGHGEIDGGRVDLSESAEGDHVTYQCVAPAGDVSIEGVYWLANVPIETFKGGSAKIAKKTIALEPAKSPETRALGDGTTNQVTLRSADGRTTIEITFDRAVIVRVQDVTSFGEPSFQIYAAIVEGNVARGVKSALSVAIKTTITPDVSDATITIDPTGPRTAFDGFGGNFVYGTDSRVTHATLDALRLTWARIPLELSDWEPTNDNDDARLTNVAALSAHDAPESTLRKRFKLDQELFKRADGRLIASVWYLPEWLYDQPMPAGQRRDHAGTVPRERWPELAECVVSYLAHAKELYGVEPALFSFNESDLGVYLKLDGDEMRDLAKVLKARFAEAGLKTKLLLGDSADLAKGLEQIGPTLADDDARTFVGALAYHPWSGQNNRWAEWASLAVRHGLPLMATEMGADADAWRDGSFATPLYALRLARRYVEQLSEAHTSVLLEWEWSDDFAMTKGEGANAMLSPRGEWLRQITQLTPQFGESVQATCDRTNVRAATLVRGEAWAIHIVNLDAARTVHVRGLPAAMKTLTLSTVDPERGSQPDREVKVAGGGCDLALPAAAMATLSSPAAR